DAARRQLHASADRDPVRGGVGGEHVEGPPGGDAEAAALADREMVVAAMAAEDAPAGVDDLAAVVAEAAMAGEERTLALAGEEAEILALALAGHLEPGGGGELADAGLRQLGEWEAE